MLLFPKHGPGNFLKTELWGNFRDFLICFPSFWDQCSFSDVQYLENYCLTYFVQGFFVVIFVVIDSNGNLNIVPVTLSCLGDLLS